MSASACRPIAGLLVLALAAGAAAASDKPTLEALSATRERPLFDPSRRPPNPPPPPPGPMQMPQEAVAAIDPPAATHPPPNATLTGVILGRQKLAIFQSAGESKSKTVRQGDEFEGWVLAEIARRSVVLQHGGERFEMKLKDATEGVPGVKKPGGGDPDTLDDN